MGRHVCQCIAIGKIIVFESIPIRTVTLRIPTRQIYRCTSLIRNTHLLGPYSRTMPRAPWWSWGGGGVSYERGTTVLKI